MEWINHLHLAAIGLSQDEEGGGWLTGKGRGLESQSFLPGEKPLEILGPA